MSQFSEPAVMRNDDALSTMSAFVPVLILGLVMGAWFGFQATQLRAEREAMRELMITQDRQVEESKKLRDSLESVTRGIAKLAAAGNPNARLIVEELKKHGVSINPDPPPGNDSGTSAK